MDIAQIQRAKDMLDSAAITPLPRYFECDGFLYRVHTSLPASVLDEETATWIEML